MNNNCKYIISTKNEQIEFEFEKLPSNKCLQIVRIVKNNKKWKGYFLKKIIYNYTDQN